MAQVYKTYFLSENDIDIPRIWSQGTPSFRNEKTENVLPHRVSLHHVTHEQCPPV